MRDPRKSAVALLLVASALCCATEEARFVKTGDSFYRFLIWNLALAWIPLLFAAFAYAVAGRGGRWTVAALAVGWILFFPNAPYMLTDFVHLGSTGTSAPLWYDALMIASFAWTALLLGLASLYLMQIVVERYIRPIWSWTLVGAVLLLSSFGVYLGRFVRFNSWDALIRPGRVGNVIRHQLENPIQHPRLVGILVILTAFLTVAYAILYAFANVQLRPTERYASEIGRLNR